MLDLEVQHHLKIIMSKYTAASEDAADGIGGGDNANGDDDGGDNDTDEGWYNGW